MPIFPNTSVSKFQRPRGRLASCGDLLTRFDGGACCRNDRWTAALATEHHFGLVLTTSDRHSDSVPHRRRATTE